MFLCLSTDAFAQPSFSVWLLHRICFFDVLLIINGFYYLLCMKFSRYIRVTRVSALATQKAGTNLFVSRLLIDSISGVVATKRALLVSCTYDSLSVLSLKIQRSGAEGIRTPDPLLARQVLSQLSYNPGSGFIYFLCQAFVCLAMGLNGLEPSTSRLSGVRSNQLSYKPF